jgi:hypothetical protein
MQNTQKTACAAKCLHRLFRRRGCTRGHVTIAEIELSVLNGQCLNRHIGSLELRSEVELGRSGAILVVALRATGVSLPRMPELNFDAFIQSCECC